MIWTIIILLLILILVIKLVKSDSFGHAKALVQATSSPQGNLITNMYKLGGK